jgi:hypothetical protein
VDDAGPLDAGACGFGTVVDGDIPETCADPEDPCGVSLGLEQAGHQRRGVDPEQLRVLESMVGVGLTTIAAVQDLDERRLPIILRAFLRLAGNDTIAVGTRMQPPQDGEPPPRP